MISSLHLINFRNHLDLQIDSNARVVVISGANGTGKTNILEAISVLAPGRSMRGCRMEEIIPNHVKMVKDWGVHAITAQQSFSTGYAIGSLRRIKMDGEVLKSQSDVLNYLKILWLLPQTENIFINAASARRKFLDRMCYNLFPEHAKNIIRYEYYLKSRMKILQQSYIQEDWLESIENNLSTLSVIIHDTRVKVIELIKESISEINSVFLRPIIHLKSFVEHVDINNIQILFKKFRNKDQHSNRSNFGVHKEDLIVLHSLKEQIAELCSTGEQKAFLVALLIAQARAMQKMSHISPVMLMDEVFSHFDQQKQKDIFNELINLSSQIWITTTKSNFNLKDICGERDYLHIHL